MTEGPDGRNGTAPSRRIAWHIGLGKDSSGRLRHRSGHEEVDANQSSFRVKSCLSGPSGRERTASRAV